jgi:hypothetical protein
MKKTLAIIIAVCSSTLSYASVTFSGTSLLNAPGVAVGDVGVLLNDNNGVGFSALSGNIGAGLSLTDSATFSGAWGNFTVIGSNTAVSTFGNVNLSGAANFNLTGGVGTGDSFAYVVFSSSTSTTIASDPVTIWSASNWLIPADGAALTWPANFEQMGSSSSPIVTTSVVPEPSTYALLVLGGLALFFVARRRKLKA